MGSQWGDIISEGASLLLCSSAFLQGISSIFILSLLTTSMTDSKNKDAKGQLILKVNFLVLI